MSKATIFGPCIKLNSEKDRPPICGNNCNGSDIKHNTRYNALSLSYCSKTENENIRQFNIQNNYNKNSYQNLDSFEKKIEIFEKSPSPIKKNKNFSNRNLSFKSNTKKLDVTKKPIQLEREVLIDHLSIVSKQNSTSKPKSIQNFSNNQANPSTNFTIENPCFGYLGKIQPLNYYPYQNNCLSNFPSTYYPCINERNCYQNTQYFILNNFIPPNYSFY